VFTNKRKAEGLTNTIKLFLDKTTVPYMTPTNIAVKAANDLITVIDQPTLATPFPQVGAQQLEAIKQLANTGQYTGPITSKGAHERY
jgi:hypothetical protein